ncbi:MAG TPA: TspO/MBR family protein, partial [Candidatus Nanoarchaeia archaeon]|nr:TspO/MBR family protein [Candidatus Nanoarchaeia archaeon]
LLFLRFLNKPALTPPSWVFGPVWTILYVLMGVALFFVWNEGWNRGGVRIAVSVFGVQLVLNTAWSLIFFGAKNPGAALIEIVLLWISILFTIILFSKISKRAGVLLVPYIVWVSFAAYLNYGIWTLN